MIKYRPHRGGLSESMKEAREFETYDEMKKHICDEWAYMKDIIGEMPFTEEDIVIKDVMGDDPRIGWKNVRYVCVKRLGREDFMEKHGTAQCIGYCGEEEERANEWIPCSVKNGPDQQEIVLVTVPPHIDEYGDEYVAGVICAYTIRTPNSGTMWYRSDGVSFGGGFGRVVPDPIAWMPLPKPYKEK